jgi:alkylation response protein AidB-like acyl-CoA dehydrogenase
MDEISSYRADLVRWIDANADRLEEFRNPGSDVDGQFLGVTRLRRWLSEEGWALWGWPAEVGGRGGRYLHRAVTGEEFLSRGYSTWETFCNVEVLGGGIRPFASPALFAEFFPRFLTGEEYWCQGFSEPDAGSDLASLRCRAVAADDGWLINGQKVWTSFAQYAKRCVLLARTGGPVSKHRGLSAFMVDMDAPGLSARPMRTMTGELEFCELFFEDVVVPPDRLIGQVGDGWAVAMSVLNSERSVVFWHRGAWLQSRLDSLVRQVEDRPESRDRLAAAYQAIYALRARSFQTQHRIDSGEPLSSDMSIDKVLMATAEQTLFDVALELLPGLITEPGESAQEWRAQYLYSRAASIYGGTGEIQRNIIAERVLGLPRG